MADLSKLLGESWDDAELPDTPIGQWEGELVSLYLDEENRTDKNDNEFRLARLIVVPDTPKEDVDPDEAREFIEKSEGEATVSVTFFLRGKRDTTRLKRKLEAIGIPLEGRTIEETFEEYDGGYRALVEVEHDDEYGPQGRDIAPASS